MRSKTLTGLLAGLSVPLLVSTAALAAGDNVPIAGKHLAQSSTETGQSGTGVRGTTGENSGGGQTAPGSMGTQPGGGSGATGTEGQGRGNGGAMGKETGAGGATTMGQPPGGSENHVKEAMKHAEAAAAAGKKGDASTIAEHARVSKTHVEAALKDKPGDEHLQAALKSLDTAIGDANMSRGDQARKAAKEAITHLKAAK